MTLFTTLSSDYTNALNNWIKYVDRDISDVRSKLLDLPNPSFFDFSIKKELKKLHSELDKFQKERSEISSKLFAMSYYFEDTLTLDLDEYLQMSKYTRITRPDNK